MNVVIINERTKKVTKTHIYIVGMLILIAFGFSKRLIEVLTSLTITEDYKELYYAD